MSKHLIFLIIIAVFIGFACGGGNQTEANRLIREANNKLAEVNNLLNKTEDRNRMLFEANIRTAVELAAYKSKKSDEAKSIAADYEKGAEMLKEISKIFDEVSRMNVHETYKIYAKLKSDEFEKRAEAVSIRKGNAQAFIEIDNHQKMTAKFDENNTKANKIFSEADEIARKAKRLEEENRDLFAGVKD